MGFWKAHGLFLAVAVSIILGVAPAARAQSGCSGNLGCFQSTSSETVLYGCGSCGGGMNIVIPAPEPDGSQYYGWQSYCSTGCCGTYAESWLYEGGGACQVARPKAKVAGKEAADLWTTRVFYARGCDGTYSLIMLRVPLNTA